MKFSFAPAIIAILFGVVTLCACEQSPAEKLAQLHSEQQSRLNRANFEHNAQLRELKKDNEEDAGAGE
jgi:hypothetical protein